MVTQKPRPIRRTKRLKLPKPRLDASDPTLLEDLLAIGRAIPREELDRLPSDGARNFDHYLDGAPRQN
ncbi:MAG: hypothetical protein HY873_14170 [Chloroflexi bacterium]|nr:hypothetical protein [Chloroflexota bacterium]